MTLFDIIILAITLSMDAFAVAVCKGLSLGKATAKDSLCIGAWFGSFQGIMPLLGYLLARAFASIIEAYVPWIALILLAFIGANMIKEAFEDEEEDECCCLNAKAMFPLAIATSIDAMATGVTFVLLSLPRVIFAVCCIGAITCTLSALGCRFGAYFGAKYRKKAVLFGGIVLVLLGIKILLSSYGILPF